ncbi:TPA: terminase family protein [Enterobacter hormaechei]|nr:terminase family protein [Enterobacter hormaechei]
MASDIYALAREFEELNVRDIDLESLSDDQIEALATLERNREEFKKYNKLAYWKPYPFQKKWIAASCEYRQRYLSAANRIGKTYGAAMELAIHLTGLYPDWWNGKRIEATGDYWVIGISQDSVNKVLMNELLGVNDFRNIGNIGTGAIPLDCIDIETKDADGSRLKKICINHVSGKQNTLHFFACTQELGVFMGSAVQYILMDEQFKNEMLIYSECLTRTLTTKGLISVTCTPLEGETDLWKKFFKNESGRLYFQSATWNDAPHITPEDIEELKAGYPVWEHETRMKGIPTVGTGAIYPFSVKEVEGCLTHEEIKKEPYRYKMLWSCDFGYSSREDADPSTLVLCAYDEVDKKIYAIQEWNSKKDVEANRLAHLPEHMASVIKNSAFPYAPLLVPHDGKKQIEGTNTTRLSEFKRLGVNVLPTVFEIPVQLKAGAMDQPNHPRSLMWTLSHMAKLFHDGTLKLDVNKLPVLMDEFRGYRFDSKGEPIDRNNHHLDALRYAAISVPFKGAYAGKCFGAKQNKWGEGRKLSDAMKRRSF